MGLFRDTETIIHQMEHNMFTDPNWPEANQLAIYKRGRQRIGTRDYPEQIQQAVRAGLKFGASRFQVQRSNRSATLPPHFALILVFFPTKIPYEELKTKRC